MSDSIKVYKRRKPVRKPVKKDASAGTKKKQKGKSIASKQYTDQPTITT